MGTVYLVEHEQTLRQVVAKVIHRNLLSDAKTMDRFRLEAQSLGQLEHPHIVSVEGSGTTSDGRPFIVLEYLRGHTLNDELREGPVSVRRALHYADQYLSALEAAHRSRIVHRDFKPANIFVVDGTDEADYVKVLDFGLAKILPDAPTDAPSPLMAPTTEGIIVGTPRYMSPEAALGVPVDERADVYAAALVLYSSLAGRGPFDHFSSKEFLGAQVHIEPEPPSHHAKSRLSPELDSIVLRALSKDPKKRFASARAFREALRNCRPLSDLPPPRTSKVVPKKGKRTGVLVFVLAIGIGLMAAAVARVFLLG